MIIIDLQKAFDTIDHEILLPKLNAVKFSKSAITWFKSQLSKKIFLVNISILGTFVVLIYVKNMPQAVTSIQLSYADNSCILYQHKDIVQTEKNNSIKTLKIFMTGLLITN